jgi:hypothetical protein
MRRFVITKGDVTGGLAADSHEYFSGEEGIQFPWVSVEIAARYATREAAETVINRVFKPGYVWVEEVSDELLSSFTFLPPRVDSANSGKGTIEVEVSVTASWREQVEADHPDLAENDALERWNLSRNDIGLAAWKLMQAEIPSGVVRLIAKILAKGGR